MKLTFKIIYLYLMTNFNLLYILQNDFNLIFLQNFLSIELFKSYKKNDIKIFKI